MSERSLALMEVEPPADGDYDLICATMMATVRGRRFLEEYARRNRMTCAQIEELAGAIQSALALRDPHDRRAQKLAEVLGYLEARIDAMLDACPPAAAPAAAEAQAEVAPAPAAATVAVERNPPLAHAHEAAAAAALDPPAAIHPVAESEPEPADFLLEALPDAYWSDRPPPHVAPQPQPQPWPRPPVPAPAEIEAELFALPGAAPVDNPPRPVLPLAAPVPAATAQTSSPSLPPLSDPLTALRSLTDEERIALFT
jgi:hypothetical protein